MFDFYYREVILKNRFELIFISHHYFLCIYDYQYSYAFSSGYRNLTPSETTEIGFQNSLSFHDNDDLNTDQA